MKAFGRIVCALMLAMMTASAALAQQPVAFDARDRTVRVRVLGNEMNGAEVSAYASGFYISAEGEVVTSLHIIDEFAKKGGVAASMNVQVAEGYDGPWVNADIIARSVQFDYLVLQIFVDGRQKRYFRRAPNPRDIIVINQTRIYTAGFPGEDGYRTFVGVITDFQGPPQPHNMLWMWRAHLQAGAGQSGSPIYLENGDVLGVYRGEDPTRPGEVYIVPIHRVVEMIAPPLTNISYGTVNVTQGLTVTQEVEVTRSAENAECAPDQRMIWTFDAPTGWRIDATSFETNATMQHGRSRVVSTDFANSARPSRVDLAVAIANRGLCVPLLARDTPGALQLQVNYNLVREEAVQTFAARAFADASIIVGDADAPVRSIELVDPSGAIRTYSRDQLLAGQAIRLDTTSGREVLVFN